MFKTIDVKTTERYQMVELLDAVKALVLESGVLHGIVTVHVPHTTAGLTLNKNYDPVVHKDILDTLHVIVPKDGNYLHIEGNSAAHIKASLFGNSETMIIEDGRIELGMFQSVFLCEFDGPRKRKVHIKIIKG